MAKRHWKAPRQHAEASLGLGPARLHMKLELTSAGLLATGMLASSILLSTALLVRVAVREGKRPAFTPPVDRRPAQALPDVKLA